MKVKKQAQWDIKLYEFINKSKDKPFKWGKWDCCIFGIEAIKEMTGELPLKSHWKNKKEAVKKTRLKLATLECIKSQFSAYLFAGLSTNYTFVIDSVPRVRTFLLT